MESNSDVQRLSLWGMIWRFAVMIGVSSLLGIAGTESGVLTQPQSLSVSVFIAIIFGTLFFWGFRLAVAFIGLAVLIFTKCLTIHGFVASSSLEVIMFLVGMMIIVGALKDLGFFTWIVQRIVSIPKLSGRKFIAVTSVASALLACAVDEVTSIIFVSTLIFQVCGRLKISPTPFILIAVLATNVGSSGTMMGNPVGIYIGNKGGLSFGDFMMWSFPIMLVALVSVIVITLIYYKRELDEFDVRMKAREEAGLSLAPKVDVPYRSGLALLILAVIAIASHHQVEGWLGLSGNSVLLVAPLVCAGIVMILRPTRARHYTERDVDWWTLLFFMLLFAVAGTIAHAGVDKVMANGFSRICGTTMTTLVPFIFCVSAVGSAFVDNVIFVAAFSPVIEQLSVNIKDMPLWWALLFGACFGGNITMIGSTANIVALGMVEKRAPGDRMTFLRWLLIGLPCTVVSGAIAVGCIMLLEPLMADRPTDKVRLEDFAAGSERTFLDKRIMINGVVDQDEAGNWYVEFRGRKLAARSSEEIVGARRGQKSSIVGTVLTTENGDKEYPVVITVESVSAPLSR
ncbi:MAG: hypothetical protein MJ025_06890 [Victivallaceae bacterium]|nr:hypothetical protein [Victivallaceae bacterium]